MFKNDLPLHILSITNIESMAAVLNTVLLNITRKMICKGKMKKIFEEVVEKS